MAVGLAPAKELGTVAGVRVGTAKAGIRYAGRRDLTVIELTEGTVSAATFTQNRFCAAPVLLTREHLAVTAPRYLLINTGNANAATGAAGLADARACCAVLARICGCEPAQVLPFSTGVIGERLQREAFERGVPLAIEALQEAGWELAAEAIMTTDTIPKGAAREVVLSGGNCRIVGIAKGSGMIRPDMATMLAFIATDARLDQARAQQWLRQAVEHSFNRVTVDGDTSTNDACVLSATGACGVPLAGAEDEQAFHTALTELMLELAQALVRDGEGASKFITVQVEKGASTAECLVVAYTVAHSPLVKTAMFASDPNWGRLVMAIGRAGIDDLDPHKVEVYLGDVCIVRAGGRAAEYTEERGQAVMDRSEITVRIVLNRGESTDTVWTSDLSHEYITVNAEYRT